MLDWPGRISTTLFLSGCTLRCPYCHNPGLVPCGSSSGTWDKLLAHLSVRRGWIDGVVLTGGEPTADPDLTGMLEALSERGIPVKLDTNGSAPHVLERVIEAGLVDYVALDVKTFPGRYARFGPAGVGESVTRSISMLLSSGVAHEFRTTVYPPLITPDELPELASSLRGGDSYAIQQFRPDRTLDATAASVAPAHPLEILQAAEKCSRYLPTTTRGV